jgi:hypothetical protein
MVSRVLLTKPPIVVMTKPKEKDGVTKYQVYRRVSQAQFGIVYEFPHRVYQPIPLDLLTLATFTDPPTQRGGRLLPFGGKKDTEGPNPGYQSSGCRCESRRRQRRSSGISLYDSSQWSIGRPVHIVRRVRPSAVGVEG